MRFKWQSVRAEDDIVYHIQNDCSDRNYTASVELAITGIGEYEWKQINQYKIKIEQLYEMLNTKNTGASVIEFQIYFE